jgi:hypothetical protein
MTNDHSMPVTFIGDVHGWSDRLERVLEQAQGDMVFMGDLIDRGPAVPAVLDRVHGLCNAGRARCLLGNHEYTLLRAVGFPGTGFKPNERLFEAWKHSFGGQSVLDAYGVTTAEALVQAMGDHLSWMVDLPWVLRGAEGERAWIAVHAGLGEHPVAAQLAQLERGWVGDDGYATPLFNKTWAHCVPCDLPMNYCIVSGHTPVSQPLICPQRVLCDTSGGLPDRQLSGVVWPSGQVIVS